MSLARKKSPAEIWAHSPCAETGCRRTLYSWGDSMRLVTWYQHGENPEHRRFLGVGESGYAWLLEVHNHVHRD
jgi:hypothetical protein